MLQILAGPYQCLYDVNGINNALLIIVHKNALCAVELWVEIMISISIYHNTCVFPNL